MKTKTFANIIIECQPKSFTYVSCQQGQRNRHGDQQRGQRVPQWKSAWSKKSKKKRGVNWKTKAKQASNIEQTNTGTWDVGQSKEGCGWMSKGVCASCREL